MTTFCRNIKQCQKVKTTHKSRKNKIYYSGTENSSEQIKQDNLQ